MGFLRRLLGGAPGASSEVGAHDQRGADEAAMFTASEATFDAHAERARVSIWLRLNDPAFESEREQQRIFGLENRIMRALDEAGVGEHDTNSLEADYFVMRLIGDDAEAIVDVISPLLVDVAGGGYLAVRSGGAGTAEERVELAAAARSASD